VISAGQICEHGPVAQVLTAPTQAYTRQLIADVPSFEHAG
jgi:ABC-type dipeptide/oligopeptide/nickel transport system ATPase component